MKAFFIDPATLEVTGTAPVLELADGALVVNLEDGPCDMCGAPYSEHTIGELDRCKRPTLWRRMGNVLKKLKEALWRA